MKQGSSGDDLDPGSRTQCDGGDRRRAVLREIDSLQAALEARRGADRPVRSSLIRAYQEAINRCYQRLEDDEGNAEGDR
jgi:hypothetical protein